MLRHVLIQLWNRRRANGWIVIEILLVYCLLWYMIDYFFVLGCNYSLPTCRNMEHTWQLDVDLLPDTHPEYLVGESDSVALEANYVRVLDRIRHAEGVEAVAVLEQWGSPGNGSYNGDIYRSRQDTLHEGSGQIISFDPREDYFNVFRYTYPDGKPVSVHDFDLSDPKAIILGHLAETALFPEGKAVGQMIESTREDRPSNTFEVKGVIGDIKRFGYERLQQAFYIPVRVDAGNIRYMEIAVRSRENLSDTRFLHSFKEQMSRELRIGNFYLRGVRSYNQIAVDTDTSFGMTNNFRIHTAMMIFFLLNIMLCVMGTFWYRVNVRREEIGLRMAIGATGSGIRKLLLLEGLCLVSVVAIPAILIESQFVYVGLVETLGRSDLNPDYLPDRTALRFILTNFLTWLLLSIAVVVVIWLPATKAARMAPAEALHYE